MVKASVIIPTYDRNTSLNECVSSILTSEVSDIEIIIVNDCKDNEVVLSIENTSPIITIVNNPKKGVASARNYGASIALAPYLIFVDDDMLLNEKAINSAINFLNSTIKFTYNANWIYEKTLINEISNTQFGRYLIYYNFTSLKGWNGNLIDWKEDHLMEAQGITSQFFAIKKADFSEIGGYNESFPFAGFEDYELYIKFKDHGFINYIDAKVLIYHNEVDRVIPESWLKRQQRGAKTRRVAVDLGFNELKIKYNIYKRSIYFLLVLFYPIMLFSLKLIPNYKLFDKIYFKFINLLQGIKIYSGYNNL